MKKRKSSLWERLLVRGEDLIMTKWVPKDKPGLLFKWLFKIPIVFYKIGLPLFGDYILLLTTTGRKSGRQRNTPLEYRLEKGTGNFIVMSGWGGNTDWRRNIDVYPHVYVQAGWKKFEAVAESLSEVEIANWLAETIRINPKSIKIWSRWAGEQVTVESPESLIRAAEYFPSYRLKPERIGKNNTKEI
jgi:deazaflavin-dependent oxidoreductase (nitroreductase family)